LFLALATYTPEGKKIIIIIIVITSTDITTTQPTFKEKHRIKPQRRQLKRLSYCIETV